MNSDLDCLYRICSCEAKGECEKGIILAANVILNRVKSSKFPNSIKAVIEQSNQFSPVSSGKYFNEIPSETVINAVDKALNGTDYSNGALYFRTVKGADNSWHQNNLTFLFDYNNHRFYK